MVEFIVCTTEGTTFGPNEDFNVENCQVLGVAKGRSEHHAIEQVFQQNEWITKAGFNIEKAFARALLTKETCEDIGEIVEYLWHDECRDYMECEFEKDHIFCVVGRLLNAIKHCNFKLCL